MQRTVHFGIIFKSVKVLDLCMFSCYKQMLYNWLYPCRYVFDSLTEQQAETLLKNHGSDGSYLLSQYDDSNNYRMSFVAQ